MSFHGKRLLGEIVVVGVLVFRPSLLPAGDCKTIVQKEAPSELRTVLLAGGDAWDLFQTYRSAAAEQKVSLHLWIGTRVILQDGTDRKQITGSWIDMLTLQTAEDVWQARLKGVNAGVDNALIDEAVARKWDLVCVPPPGPENGGELLTGEPPPPPPIAADVGFKAGMQYAAGRDYKNALKEFAAVEKDNPSYPNLQMNMGVAYLQLKDYVRATQHLTKALEQDPKDAETQYNMACLQARLGQKEDAVKSLEAAVENGLQDSEQLLRTDSDLSTLRGFQPFQKLLTRVSTK